MTTVLVKECEAMNGGGVSEITKDHSQKDTERVASELPARTGACDRTRASVRNTKREF